MKWVTRDYVHLDRVAAPWLIKRFIDTEAEFSFVPSSGGPHPLPDDAIPFGLPGVEISAHDENGSTFRKLIRKYGLEGDPALTRMADLVEDAIAYVLHEKLGKAAPRADACPEAAGLAALSEGMMFVAPDDHANLQQSQVFYDVLYKFYEVQILLEDRPDLRSLPPPQLVPKLKEMMAG